MLKRFCLNRFSAALNSAGGEWILVLKEKLLAFDADHLGSLLVLDGELKLGGD